MAVKKKNKQEKDMLRLENELKDIILNIMSEKVESMLESNKMFSKYLKQIQSKKMDPFEAADKITKSLIK